MLQPSLMDAAAIVQQSENDLLEQIDLMYTDPVKIEGPETPPLTPIHPALTSQSLTLAHNKSILKPVVQSNATTSSAVRAITLNDGVIRTQKTSVSSHRMCYFW